MNDIAQLLVTTPLGEALSTAEASELAQAGALRSVGKDAPLFTMGDQGDALYIILQGAAKVVLGNRSTGLVDVATLGAGQIVGELEVMTRSLRVATVVATEETTALELSKATLDRLLDDNRAAANKLVQYVARTLARRLASVNHRLVGHEQPATPETAGPIELDEADVIPIDDDDLDVLDKLWS
jgi:CRP-like cAMP-binding protein